MKLFKNIEIARIYGVNPTTVTNWIEASLSKKNNLILEKNRERSLIVDNQQNRIILEQLTQTGKKHKSKDSYKLVEPKNQFYQIFNGQNLVKLINSLENYREIPHNFTYLNGGAEYWRSYAERTFRENITNTITNTSQMLDACIKYILKSIPSDYKLNIIDIGVGDSSPVREFLQFLIDNDLLNKYIAIDFSPEMLDISEYNINKWFNGRVNFERHIADISTDSIQDILFYSSKNNSNNTKSKNIVLFIGSTIENQMDYHKTLANLKENVGKDDLLLIGETLDSRNSKVYFDLSANRDEDKNLINQKNRWIPELLNIDRSLYDEEVLYDENEKTRKMNMILTTDLDILFKFKEIDFETTISFHKGEKITVWKHKHHSITDIIKNLSSLDLIVRNFTTSEDLAQALIICSLNQ